jgi:hypothetical protein
MKKTEFSINILEDKYVYKSVIKICRKIAPVKVLIKIKLSHYYSTS